MARVSIDILGVSELKCTGMGEFNSDDHYIYYYRQESLRRNGVAFRVNKRIQNAVRILQAGFIFPQLWRLEDQGFLSDETSVLDLQAAAFSLCPQTAFSLGRHTSFWSFSSYEDTSPVGAGPHPYDLILP